MDKKKNIPAKRKNLQERRAEKLPEDKIVEHIVSEEPVAASVTGEKPKSSDSNPSVETVASEASAEPEAVAAKKGIFANALESLNTNTLYKAGNTLFAITIKEDEALILNLYAKNSDNGNIRELGSYTSDKPNEIYNALSAIFGNVWEDGKFPPADEIDVSLVKKEYQNIFGVDPQPVPANLVEQILKGKENSDKFHIPASQRQYVTLPTEEDLERERVIDLLSAEPVEASPKHKVIQETIHTSTVTQETTQKIEFSNPVVVLLGILTAGLGLKTVADAQQKPEKQRSWVDKVTTFATGTLAAGATLATIFTLVNNHHNAKSPAQQK